MRKWITILLTLSLLLTLAACGKKEEAPPEEDTPTQGDDSTLPDDPPEETPEEEIPEMDGDVTFYKGEGITFALPVEYAPQLLLDTGKDVWEPYQPLMSVYELASLEAAEADFGDSAGYGFLFEIGAIDAADLQDFLDRELPASWIFAKDSNRYYIYTEPTDVQLYRRGGEEAITDEDRETWSALSALGPIVREDTIQRNNLTPYSAR